MNKPGVCMVCGCTDDKACKNEQGQICSWFDDDHTLCSNCVSMMKRQDLVFTINCSECGATIKHRLADLSGSNEITIPLEMISVLNFKCLCGAEYVPDNILIRRVNPEPFTIILTNEYKSIEDHSKPRNREERRHGRKPEL